MRAAVSILILAVAIAAAAAGEPAWERVGEERGIVVESRDVAGSSLHDVRATAQSPASVSALLGVLWSHEQFARLLPRVKHIEVLRDAGDERLVYEQVHVPLLKDRDIVFRVHRYTDPRTGIAEIDSLAVTNEGPPERDDHVRVRESHAHWTLVPRPEGGTTVAYLVRADIGGNVPAWVVNRAQREAVPDLVHAILAEAERRTR